jgi:hypothetical protein
MARYSVGTRSTGAGSTTLPIGALVAAAANDVYLIECGAFNTTTTACAIALRRHTTAGTPGSGLTEIPWDPDTTAATATAYDTYTSTGPTLTGGFYATASLGAAIGAGVIWTFGNKGIRIPKGTGNGLALIVATGTGQILDWYMIWDE